MVDHAELADTTPMSNSSHMSKTTTEEPKMRTITAAELQPGMRVKMGKDDMRPVSRVWRDSDYTYFEFAAGSVPAGKALQSGKLSASKMRVDG